MKTIRNIVASLVAVLVFNGCDQGIDPITEVAPGADASAPTIKINSPTEGLTLKVNEVLASVDINFEATDDIELASVKVLMDGTEINTYNSFKDYRRLVVNDMVYNKVADGNHTLTISATDLEGKTTATSVNFEKEPAYIPKYAGEILYMSFDGDYTDLISFQKPTVAGSPGFADDGVKGKAYAGATDSYLTLPTEGLKNPELSAIFWLKINAVPDRAGILVMSPPMINGGADNDLTKGFRFFRENGASGKQRFKLNVGSGDTGNWFDGGEAADVDPATDKWVNMAFTISGSEAVVYIDGQIVAQGALDGVDWTDSNVLSIMSGAPNFTQWDHWSDQSLLDELRIFDKVLTQEEVQTIIEDDSGTAVSNYPPTFDGEMFYMPFDGNNKNLFTDTEATMVGATGFAGESVDGTDAFAGTADSYLTFPADNLTTNEFSATLWYKMNPDPDRNGILVMGPEDTGNANYPDVQNLRTNGFRFFREAGGDGQVFKLNVGNGIADSWFDGGAAASIPVTMTNWVHLAFTISGTECVVYINGEVVAQGAFDGVDWTGCDLLSIASGAPRFTEWGHLSDQSFIDELRLYGKALSQEEIQNIMNSDL